MPKGIGDMPRIMLKCSENYATKKPDDYVIATGHTFTVKQFVEKVCKILKIKLLWVVKE